MLHKVKGALVLTGWEFFGIVLSRHQHEGGRVNDDTNFLQKVEAGRKLHALIVEQRNLRKWELKPEQLEPLACFMLNLLFKEKPQLFRHRMVELPVPLMIDVQEWLMAELIEMVPTLTISTLQADVWNELLDVLHECGIELEGYGRTIESMPLQVEYFGAMRDRAALARLRGYTD